MKDNPLIISLLIGLIVLLVIAGVSLLVQMNSLSATYKKEVAKNISLEKAVEDLKGENSQLTKDINEIKSKVAESMEKNRQALKEAEDKNLDKIKELEDRNAKLEKLNEKLEEDLKEELMKRGARER